jgi:hypothetical protein
MAFSTAVLHGRLARVSYNGTVIDHTSRWSINWNRDVATFGRQGQTYKNTYGGQAGWSGSAEFAFSRSSEQTSLQNLAVSTNGSSALTSTASSMFKFCFDTTANRLQGDVWVTGMSIDAPVGDVVKVNFTFTGDGPLEFSS